MDLTAAQIAEACAGRLRAGDPDYRFHEIALDSRAVSTGCLFAAIPGERVDGHDYIGDALTAGAAGALVMRTPARMPPGGICIEVDDTTQALQALAAAWRARLHATVIGVAGSNGKTTTKETLAAVCRRAGKTWATPGNANSQVGAPLALLATPEDADFVVLELGTSAPGELGRLARMARPDAAIITAAFAEHLEWLESIAGVIEAETEILDFLEPGGRALVGSAEPDLVTTARRRRDGSILSLGMRPEDDWRITEVGTDRAGTRFALVAPDGARTAWELPLLGAPAAWAGAFAAALAIDLGLEHESIVGGLSDVRPADHRLIALSHPSRPLLVVDDCYNSNPASCIAAVETASCLAEEDSRLLLVVGDMLELGSASDAAHEEVGTALGDRADRIDHLITVGPAAERIATVARQRGVTVSHVADATEATRAVETLLADGRASTVLAKASRGIGLDRLVAALIPEETSGRQGKENE